MVLFTALVFFLKEIPCHPSLLSLRCQPCVCLWRNRNETSVHRPINTCRSTLRWLLLMNASPPCFSPLSDHTHVHARTHAHSWIVLHYESRTSYAITSDNNTNDYPLCAVYWLAPECALNRADVTSLFSRWSEHFWSWVMRVLVQTQTHVISCLSLLALLMIPCMNTYLLSPNHCYNWAPCLGVCGWAAWLTLMLARSLWHVSISLLSLLISSFCEIAGLQSPVVSTEKRAVSRVGYHSWYQHLCPVYAQRLVLI